MSETLAKLAGIENLTSKEQEELQRLLTKAKQPKMLPLVFEPTEREAIWGINEYVNIRKYSYWDNLPLKVYRTEAEAVKASIQLKAITQCNLQVSSIIAREHPTWVCDWGNNLQSKCVPEYWHKEDTLHISSSLNRQKQHTLLYTPSKVWEQIDPDLIKIAIGV